VAETRGSDRGPWPLREFSTKIFKIQINFRNSTLLARLAFKKLTSRLRPYLRQWRSRSRSKWNNVTVIIHLSPSSTDSAVGLSSLKFLARSSCSSSQILSLLCNFSLQIIINYFIFAQTQSKFIPNIHVCYMLNTILILLESKKMSPVPQSIMC